MLKYIAWISVLLPSVIPKPQVVLTHNSILHPGDLCCPEDEIIFTCTVIGSRVLHWRSNEYIGSGGTQLEFLDIDEIGRRINSSANRYTFAILIDANNGSAGGPILLQSELHIRVSNQSSTVYCSSDVNTTNISFTVLTKNPDVPQDASATEFPLSRPGICVLLVDWDPPNFIDGLSIKQYVIHTSRESEIQQINETTTLASFELPCNELTNLTINITAIDICGRMSEPTANFVPTFVVTEPSDVTHTTVSPSTATTQAPQRFGILTLDQLLIVAISGGVLLVLLVLSALLCILAVYVHSKFREVIEKCSIKELRERIAINNGVRSPGYEAIGVNRATNDLDDSTKI